MAIILEGTPQCTTMAVECLLLVEAAIYAMIVPRSVLTEMEVSPQENMANPQGMKVFAVERHGLPRDFVSSLALCGVQSSSLVLVPNRPIVWGPVK